MLYKCLYTIYLFMLNLYNLNEIVVLHVGYCICIINIISYNCYLSDMTDILHPILDRFSLNIGSIIYTLNKYVSFFGDRCFKTEGHSSLNI